MKSQTNITLDTNVLLAIRERKINISGLINEYLKEFLNLKAEKNEVKLEQLNSEILKQETEILEKKKIREETEKEIEKHKGEIIDERGILWKSI